MQSNLPPVAGRMLLQKIDCMLELGNGLLLATSLPPIIQSLNYSFVSVVSIVIAVCFACLFCPLAFAALQQSVQDKQRRFHCLLHYITWFGILRPNFTFNSTDAKIRFCLIYHMVMSSQTICYRYYSSSECVRREVICIIPIKYSSPLMSSFNRSLLSQNISSTQMGIELPLVISMKAPFGNSQLFYFTCYFH